MTEQYNFGVDTKVKRLYTETSGKMTEKRLFIKGEDMYSNRILDESATFKKARNWNINLPKEREFKTGEGICTDRDDTAYRLLML